MTRHQLESYRLTAERETPTRARAVLRLIDYALAPQAPGRRERRGERRKPKKHGHPARRRHAITKRNIQMLSPDERRREETARKIGGLMREALAVAPKEDGELVGALEVVARYATPHLLGDFALDPGQHTRPFEHWLMAKLGDVLREPDVEGYLRWREEARERARAAGGKR